MSPSSVLLLALCTLISTAHARALSVEREADQGYLPGRTVHETLDITWEVGNPNGNARQLIMVNGQFPSPNLVFNEDDNVEITVRNHMPFNTTIHWHGLKMQGTPWSDGVPGLGQEPIAPGGSYVYRFSASPAGTYWYHSHSRATLLDGLYGALFIRPKAGTPAPWSLISSNPRDINAMRKAAADPILMTTSDWTNYTSQEYLAAQVASELDLFCVDSILVNGKGSVYCPPLQEILSLVNPGIAEVLLPGVINDKGCLPFVPITEDQFLPGRPDLIPPHLWDGCVAANGSYAIIEVDPDTGWASLNIVMASTLRITILGIDNHEMWVYEVDGHYIEPQKADTLALYPGQRHAVMVKLDQTPGEYNIRVADDGAGQIMSAYAILKYKGARPLRNQTVGYVDPKYQTQGYITYGGQPRYPNVTRFDGNTALTPPFPPLAPAVQGDEMYVFLMGRDGAAYKWTLSGEGLYPVDAYAFSPLLYDPNGPAGMDPDLTIRTKNGSWVDLILQSGALPGEPVEIGHAIHKHTSKFWIIGAGNGVWNYSTTAEAIAAQPGSFNLVNPNYRDTAITLFSGAAWVALRYFVDNPGPWLLHCHVETHLAGGMALAIMDGVDKWPQVPPQYAIGRNGH